MDIDFSRLSLDEVNTLYKKASADLKQALIGGAPWEDLRNQREIVTELAIELNKKRFPQLFPPTSPAESKSRRE